MIPQFLEVCAVCLLFFLVFAIFLVSFLKGKLMMCSDSMRDKPDSYTSFEDLSDAQLGFLHHPLPWGAMSGDEKAWFGPYSDAGDIAGRCEFNATGDWNGRPCCYGRWPEFSDNFVPSGKDVCKCWGYSWVPAVSQSFDNIVVATLSPLPRL